MQIIFLSVGKKHDENFRNAIEDYTERITRFCTVTWCLVPPEIIDEKSKAKGMQKEAEHILGKLETGDKVILLDEKGKEWTTIGVAETIAEMQSNSVKRLVFVIGGAYGVAESVKERAHYTWALSKLTFPHMLVRLILAEQIYRGVSILQGSKYHHE